MSGILHPKCGKRFPDSSRTGHCAGCCETFYGLAAFERHQTLEGGRVRCAIPTPDSKEPWWKDGKGRWHYGERLTEEQKEKLGWTA